MQGRIEEALAQCDAALRLKPEWVQAHPSRLDMLWQAGKSDEQTLMHGGDLTCLTFLLCRIGVAAC
jgi:hypothetical protein